MIPNDSDIDNEEPTDPDIVFRAAPKKPTQIPTQPPTPQVEVQMPDMGALDAFMRDPSVTEIMVNDIRNVMIEREGKLAFSGYAFPTVEELNRLVRNILDITGGNLSHEHPYIDSSLPDGSRLNIVIPPITINGPCITIRKFPTKRFNVEDLMNQGMLDRRIAYFLNVCVVGRLNILVSGGTGTGKTTLLNALMGFVPKGERIVTIEDTAELAIIHTNSVRMLTRPQSPLFAAISARDLVSNALRMRPDRIIIGEVRKSEAFDMLQAMNTGHAGSMTTIHSNTQRDALGRLETLCMLAGSELPLMAIRKQIASALDLIVQIKRFKNGSRQVIGISEVTGMEGDTILTQDLFNYEKPTGLVPTFLDTLKDQGLEFPQHFFG